MKYLHVFLMELYVKDMERERGRGEGGGGRLKVFSLLDSRVLVCDLIYKE